MRAVNLLPENARRGRPSAGMVRRPRQVDGISPKTFAIAFLVIVIVIVLLRVLADNTVNDRKATLAAVQAQIATEQAEAAKLSTYVSFVQAAQQREAQVRAIADQRFPWRRRLDQLSRALPASTSLTSLSASLSGSPVGASSSSSAATAAAPTFTLAGCARTPNQNGVATVLRRLAALPGVTDVGFQGSTRDPGCGNSFNLSLSYAASAASSPTATTTGATAGTSPGTTTAATATTVTTSAATTSTTTATTTTGSAG